MLSRPFRPPAGQPGPGSGGARVSRRPGAAGGTGGPAAPLRPGGGRAAGQGQQGKPEEGGRGPARPPHGAGMRRGLAGLHRPVAVGRASVGQTLPGAPAPASPRPPGQRGEGPAAAQLTSRVMVFPVRVFTKICMARPAAAGRGGGGWGRGHACGRGARAHPQLARAMAAPRKSDGPARTGFPAAPEEGRGAGGEAGLRLPAGPAAASRSARCWEP